MQTLNIQQLVYGDRNKHDGNPNLILNNCSFVIIMVCATNIDEALEQKKESWIG